MFREFHIKGSSTRGINKMNKSEKFRAICDELRSALGKETAVREILECARLVLDKLDDDVAIDSSFGEGRRTIDQIPLYELFERSPWKIYLRESIEFSDY